MGIKHTKVAGGVDNPAYDVSKGEWNDDHDISTLDIVDLSTAETDDALVLAPDGAGGVEFRAEAGGGGGGVTDADYLVGTSHAGLSAEIVVGTTPGGELGGTWASPTVDATHSGSAHHSAVTVGTGLDLTGQLIDLDLSEVAAGGELGGFMDAPTVDASHSGSTHAATQAAAESTAAGALTTHAAAADPHTGYLKESVVSGLAAPGLTLGTTNTAGVALTAIATDATILAFDGTGPAAVGTQAVGAATVAARRDHVHATGAGTPSTQAFGDAAAAGSGPAASMTDHKHAMPADPVTAHAAASDPHTGYRLESADHTHASTGIQGGTVAYSALTGTPTITTIATDTIWAAAGDIVRGTGNDTASVLSLGAAGGHLARINGAIAWDSGTSVPTGATGDRYWRTDLGLEIYYDGTQWLTTQVFEHHLMSTPSAGISATANDHTTAPSWAPDYGIYLLKFHAAMYAQTTLDSGKYWTLNLYGYDAGTKGSALATVTNNGLTPSTYIRLQATINAALGAGVDAFTVDAVKTSTPGALFAGCMLTYRLIVT